MSPPVTGVDHLLVGVRDLEAARATYARLGFTLTPRGSHIGWGTANYCIMFADGYVELLGIVDPAKFTNRLDAFLARREGLLGLAFATADADAAHAALTRAGVEPETPKDLARNLELPEGIVRPRFRLVHLPAAATPALSAFICQHLTPDLVRRPAWLEHPNGACGLAAVTVVVDDPPALATAYARLLGVGAVTPTDDMLSLRVGSTTLVFVRPDDFGLIYSEVVLDPALAPPFIAGMTVTVTDLAAAARVLDDNGVTHDGGARSALVVPPAETCGVALEFRR